MEVRGNVPNEEAFKKFRAKKRTLTETRTVNNNPKKLEEKSKPDDGMIELEGGFTMYPAEVLEFSDGTDSWV
ncbi:MAG: hypothetical protein GXY01_08455 [Clostridiales bacterium]|nr:hypothetical protein [Clostridiales bacterium]